MFSRRSLFLLTVILFAVTAESLLVWAVSDGTGNDIFVGNVGIGTTTPQGALIAFNGNVGIGTWAPTSAVQVVGTMTATAFSGDGSLLANVNVTGGGFRDDGTVSRLDVRTDNVGIGTTSAGNGKLLVYGANVGIGTVAQIPSAILNVSSVAAVNLFKIEDSGDNDTDPFVVSSTGNIGIGTTDPKSGKLIAAGGNVGIGSLTPGQVLDVNGTIRSISGGLIFPNGTTQVSAAPSGSTNQLQYNNNGVFGGVSVSGVASSGNIGIGTSQTNSRLQIFDGNVGIGTFTAASALLDVSSTRTVNLFYVNDDGAGDVTPFLIPSFGSVGIGTLSIQALLDVEGVGTIGSAQATSPPVVLKGSSGGIDMIRLQRDGYTFGLSGAGGGMSFNDPQFGTIMAGFYPSTTVLRLFFGLSSNGAFTTRGGMLSASTFSTAAGTDLSANLLGIQGGLGTGTGEPGDILFLTGTELGSGTTAQSGSTRAVIQRSTGNVGIGSRAPNALVEINTTAAQDLFQLNDGGVGDVTPFVISSTGNVGIATSNPFGGQLIIPTTNGNVGIGSLTPGKPLDVTGTLRATVFAGDGSAISDVGGFTDDGTVLRLSTSTDNIGIGTTSAGSGKLLVYGGNVGIGTVAQNPSALLEISSNAAQDLFKVLDAGSGDTSAFTIRSNGNVGVGTILPRAALEIKNTAVFATQYNNGNSGTSKTIDWTLGSNQKVTMTGDCTFTFTAPGSVSRLLLQMTQDGTGGRTATWPATVKWPTGTKPVLTTTATTGTDFISCLFDGTNYYCTDMLNFI